MKYAIRISYLGKNYCGWQKQNVPANKAPLLPSIQETVEAAVSKLLDQETKVVGSGRTDAGVNALGQVAHFWCNQDKYTTEIVRMGLNSLLPVDIRVLNAKVVDDRFHAQTSAVKKQYSYYFQQGACALPHLLDTSWWIQKKLNIEAMSEAISYLRGEHNFKPFQGAGAPEKMSTVRSLLEAEVSSELMPHFPGQDLNEEGFRIVRIRLVGTGFLKQMVRGIAGTLLQIGENRRPASDMADILSTLDRKKVGPTAPAKGLTLERVWYSLNDYGNSN